MLDIDSLAAARIGAQTGRRGEMWDTDFGTNLPRTHTDTHTDEQVRKHRSTARQMDFTHSNPDPENPKLTDLTEHRLGCYLNTQSAQQNHNYEPPFSLVVEFLTTC